MTKKTLIEFPCDFPIKIIGTNSENFTNELKSIALKHFPKMKADAISEQASKRSNFLSLTVVVFAKNQEMLDAFYNEITKHPDVKMVL